MPNWIAGSLKVRGKYDDVKNFFMTNLNQYKMSLDKDNCAKYTLVPKDIWLTSSKEYCEPGYREFLMEIVPGKWVYVEGTARAFITSDYISFCENEQSDKVVAVCNINQAWSFDDEEWIDISKKFNVDIRLYGFECGMCFGQEIEIVNGEIVTSETMEYKDYLWECPFPLLGG